MEDYTESDKKKQMGQKESLEVLSAGSEMFG